MCRIDGVPIASCFVFNDPATTEIYTLSLHDALPISAAAPRRAAVPGRRRRPRAAALRAADVDRLREPGAARSEEHTSELQSRQYLVCRLLLEKKKKLYINPSDGDYDHHLVCSVVLDP